MGRAYDCSVTWACMCINGVIDYRYPNLLKAFEYSFLAQDAVTYI